MMSITDCSNMVNNGIALWGLYEFSYEVVMRALQYSCAVGSYAHFTDGK